MSILASETKLYNSSGHITPRARTCIRISPEESISLRKKLGCGTFSTCWRASWSLHNEPCIVAVKLLKMNKHTPKDWEREQSIHEQLHHPNIVEYYSAFATLSFSGCILELCTGGTLSQLVRTRNARLMRTVVVKYTKQILQAVAYLHEKSIVHRDIKPSNLLIHKNRIKLCDFGLAARWKDGDANMMRITGTPNYVAPEIIHKKPRPGYTNIVDCWSVGCVCYFMMTGHALYPVPRGKRKVLYRAIRNDPLPAIPTYCGEPFKFIVTQLLQKKAERRMSAQAALEMF